MVRQPLARAKLKLVRLQFLPFAKVLGLLLSAFLAASAHAQQASTPAPSPTGVPTDQELAKSVHNPFEDFVKVPIQSTGISASVGITTPETAGTSSRWCRFRLARS